MLKTKQNFSYDRCNFESVLSFITRYKRIGYNLGFMRQCSLLYVLKKAKLSFLRYIGCLNFTTGHIKQAQATQFSKLLTSCLTPIRKLVIRYCEKFHERSGKTVLVY